MPDTTHDGKPLPEPACTECGGNGYHTDECPGYLEEQREMLRVQLKEMTSARDGLRAEVGRLEERLDDAHEALDEQEEEAATATIQRNALLAACEKAHRTLHLLYELTLVDLDPKACEQLQGTIELVEVTLKKVRES